MNISTKDIMFGLRSASERRFWIDRKIGLA